MVLKSLLLTGYLVCSCTDVQAELDSVEAELELVEVQIAELLQKQTELTTRRKSLLQQLEEACDAAQPSSSSSSSSSKSSRADPVMSEQERRRYDRTGAVHTWLYSYSICLFVALCLTSECAIDFPWCEEVEQHLKDSFHLSKFRPLQLRAVNLTMSGKDLFLVMPTGRGKSLCYQLPALCSKGSIGLKLLTRLQMPLHSLSDNSVYSVKWNHATYVCVSGFTLVVTPLVSLMEDQIMYLKSINVSAVMLNASSGKVMISSSILFLYFT